MIETITTEEAASIMLEGKTYSTQECFITSQHYLALSIAVPPGPTAAEDVCGHLMQAVLVLYHTCSTKDLTILESPVDLDRKAPNSSELASIKSKALRMFLVGQSTWEIAEYLRGAIFECTRQDILAGVFYWLAGEGALTRTLAQDLGIQKIK